MILSAIVTPQQIQNALDAEPAEILRAVHKRIVDTEKLMTEYRNFAMNQQTDIEMLQERVTELIEDMGSSFDIEIPLPFKLSWKHYDIGLEEYPILIEVDGDYWHGNKKVMTEEQKINWMQMKNKQNDLLKDWVAKNKGYKLIRIWESDIKDDLPAVRAKIRKTIREVKSLKEGEEV